MNEDVTVNAKTGVGGRMWFKCLAVVLVLAFGAFGMQWLNQHGPVADKQAPEEILPVVRVVQARYSDRQLYVKTQGRVDPRTQTQAAAEVMGRVVEVSPKFKPGGRFSRGEVMLEIDEADYRAALAQAESTLANVQLNLVREEARAVQALRDWNKLGRGEASPLVLRVPHIKSAKAQVKAADSALKKAARDLERTQLKAPYDCLVEAIHTDLGSYITPGMRLADLQSTSAFEVRVPVTLEEFGFLKQGEHGVIGGEVLLEARVGGKMRQWKGEIIRSEGRVDRKTMTMYQVVKVVPNAGDGPLAFPPSGLFVRARIKGRVMPGVAELPRAALRQDKTLLVLDKQQKLRIVAVDVSRTMESTVLVKAGITAGDWVIVSPLETPVAGMRLRREENRDSGQGSGGSDPAGAGAL